MVYLKKKKKRDYPGDPVVETSPSIAVGGGFNSWSGS